jgi:Tfp pilus assembly protein PilX
MRRIARLGARLRARVAGHGDEGVAMMSALMMILIMTGLSVLVLALVVSQVVPTQFARKNTRTIYAAEAGIETALGQLRTAVGTPDVTGAVYGSTAKLPCSLAGTVSDADGQLTYQVTVRYYTEDPAGRDETWLEGHKMVCAEGLGTSGLQPQYAYITSAGAAETGGGLAAGQADRTMSSIYRFNVTATNVSGGRIYTFATKYCLQADNVAVGSNVTYKAYDDCGNDDDRELWLWGTDYEIKLAVTTLPGAGTPLCITGPGTAYNTEKVTLQPCKASTDAARWNQLWSWQGGSHWEGEKTDINGYSGVCLFQNSKDSSDAKMKNQPLYAGQSCASDQEWGSFNPDPAVGAGAASYATHQVINFLEFGRCFDVTDTDVGKSFMIIYPCKQDPATTTGFDWNHKWFYTEPATGQASSPAQNIYVYQNNDLAKKYCLISPTVESGSQYPTLSTNCTDPRTQWTRFGDTGNYGTSYRFLDYKGRCISIGDKYNGAWSKMIVTTCTTGLDQKWNAPPENVSASVGHYLESVGG